jgi:hypothetical protein
MELEQRVRELETQIHAPAVAAVREAHKLGLVVSITPTISEPPRVQDAPRPS